MPSQWTSEHFELLFCINGGFLPFPPPIVISLADFTAGYVSSGYDPYDDDSGQMAQALLANDDQARQQVINCLSEPVVNTSGVSDADLPAPAETVTGGSCCSQQPRWAVASLYQCRVPCLNLDTALLIWEPAPVCSLLLTRAPVAGWQSTLPHHHLGSNSNLLAPFTEGDLRVLFAALILTSGTQPPYFCSKSIWSRQTVSGRETYKCAWGLSKRW